MDIDEVCFERSETEYCNLEDLIIPPDPLSKHLIEYFVKVLLKGDITICPGEEVLVESACIIQKGIMDYCLHILKNEKIPLTLMAEGSVSELFSGRVVLMLANYKGETNKLSCGTEVAFIIANKFSLN